MVARVDFVATVDVGSEKPPLLATRKRVYFMCGCVCAKHPLFVDIVRVAGQSAGVVLRKGEGVEVLGRGYYGRDWRDRVVGGAKVSVNERVEDGDRMIWIHVDVACDVG